VGRAPGLSVRLKLTLSYAGVVTGHIGDRVGRRGVLVGTLLVMGVATCPIGLREGAVEQRVRTS
jgi:MFS family permease